MNWKLKSMVQRACATLPFAREDLYYGLQKTFGRSRTHEPLEYVREAAEMAVQDNAGYRVVSIFPDLQDGHAVAEVTLLQGTTAKKVTEKLD